MSDYNNPIFFDPDIGNSIDNALEQIEISPSIVRLKERPVIDPLTTAALLLKCRAIRMEHVRDYKSDIDDISWHILLDLMVSTNAGKPVSVHELAITHNLTTNTMSRYVQYLVNIELIDWNIGVKEGEGRQLKLTVSGDTLIQSTLDKISHGLMNF